MPKKNRPLTNREQYYIFLKVCWNKFVVPFNWHHFAFILMIYGFFFNFLFGLALFNIEGIVLNNGASDIKFHLLRLTNPELSWTPDDYYPPLFHSIGYILRIIGVSAEGFIIFIGPAITWLLIPISLYYFSKEYWKSKHYAGLSIILFFLGTIYTNFTFLTVTYPHAISMALLFIGATLFLRYENSDDNRHLKKAALIGFISPLIHGVTFIYYWIFFMFFPALLKKYKIVFIALLFITAITLSPLGQRFNGYVYGVLGFSEATVAGQAIKIADQVKRETVTFTALFFWCNPFIVYWAWREFKTSPHTKRKLFMYSMMGVALITSPIDVAYRPFHLCGIMAALLSPRQAEKSWRRHPNIVILWGILMFWGHVVVYFGNVMNFMGIFAAYGIIIS